MANTTKAIQVLNQLLDERFISRYALGGAFGALFYLEPTNTEDIDVFIHLQPVSGSDLVSLKPIFDRLIELGYGEWSDDKLVVSGWPIQFLPATKPLEIEALDRAQEQQLVPGLRTWVPGPEYLMALALDLGRPKDKLRLEQFHRQKAYDPLVLETILKRYQLEPKWRKVLGLFDESPQE
jgi:hypothetical protein